MKNRGKRWKQSPLYIKHLSFSLSQPSSQKGRLAASSLSYHSELPLNCPFILVISLMNVPTGAPCTCINPSLGKTAINNYEVCRVSAHTHMVEDSHNLKIASSPGVPASNHAWLSRETLTEFNSSYILLATSCQRFIWSCFVFTLVWAQFCYQCRLMIRLLAQGSPMSEAYVLKRNKNSTHGLNCFHFSEWVCCLSYIHLKIITYLIIIKNHYITVIMPLEELSIFQENLDAS